MKLKLLICGIVVKTKGAEPMTMLVNYKNNSIEHYHYDYVNAICEEDIIIKKIKKN